jgi:PPK2 family polyphosphate:nucleotide phosphotransferase
MKINTDEFRVDKTVRLAEWPTRTAPLYSSEAEYGELLGDHVMQLSGLQQLLEASAKYAVLLIFQAMDAAGKDGVIRHVLSGINPQGCQVSRFRSPSPTELAHDFLWRTTRELPARGMIGVFNRSYYEEVLVTRVHPEILAAENLPDMNSGVWAGRFQSINEMERHLTRNGTRIVKFYLHLSRKEQSKRFLSRIDKPDKNWKFNARDIAESEFWDGYMHAYEEALSATSSPEAPWYVIPADDKENARLIVSQVIVDLLAGLDMRVPEISAAQRQEMQAIRARLTKPGARGGPPEA